MRFVEAVCLQQATGMSSLFFRIDAWVIALALGAGMFAFWLLGLLVGRRLRTRLESTVPGHGKVEDACLALLGLLLAFTFAAAYSQFDNRRHMVVAEANIIQTFAARAELLPEPARTQVRQLLRQYVRQRLHMVDLVQHPQDWPQYDVQTRIVQAQITEVVTETARQLPQSAVLAGLLEAMDGMVNDYETRVVLVQEHIPYLVLALLSLVSLISAFLLGRSHGIAEKHHPLVTAVFIILVAFVVDVTLDLDQPHRGMIQVSQAPMQRLAQSLAQ